MGHTSSRGKTETCILIYGQRQRERKEEKRTVCRMAYSRSLMLMALLVALLTLFAPQPTEGFRFFRGRFFPRFACGFRVDRFRFKRAARLGDGEDFCLTTLQGASYVPSRVRGTTFLRCLVTCSDVPSPVSSAACDDVTITFRAFGRGDSCETD